MRRTFQLLVAVYALLAGALFYWQLCADLQHHPANPRYYLVFQGERGTIFDRQGRALASSVLEGESYRRQYASPSLAHIVGYFHSRYGLTGLERLYHQELSGGRMLFTTLDLELQREAEHLLGERAGAVVVLNPKTGELLALVSTPGVDGNDLDENWPDYLDDKRSPFLNRATQGLYPPGSLVKPMIYAAALETGTATLEQVWQDQGVLKIEGRTVSNFGAKAHGRINLNQALAYSSNVVFAQLAMDLGGELVECFHRFGLGQEVPFELGNQSGFLPKAVPSRYDAAQLGIGQGELLVTPLQMAQVVAAIANGGLMMRPFVVWEVRGGLKMRQITRPQVLGRVMEPETAQVLQEAMVLAAQEGTAQTEFSEVLSYGGKTGTAQVGAGRDHAWFIGFAPKSDPRVVVAVLLEHGGSGGGAAAPLGAALLQRAVQMSE